MLRSQKNEFGWRANVRYNVVFQSMNVVDFSFCMENVKLQTQCTFHSGIHLTHCFSSCRRLGRRSTPPPQSTSGRTSTSGRRSGPSRHPKNGARSQRWLSEPQTFRRRGGLAAAASAPRRPPRALSPRRGGARSGRTFPRRRGPRRAR